MKQVKEKLDLYHSVVAAKINKWTERHLIALAHLSGLEFDEEELRKIYREEIKGSEECPHV